MKRLTTFFLIFLLTLTSANAQKINENPGITPTNWLFGFEKITERIKLALTFKPEDKAEVGMEIAYERIAELNKLILENNLESVENNKNEYVEALDIIKENIEKINKELEMELEDELRLKKMVLEHKLYLNNMRDNLTGLSEEQATTRENLIEECLTELQELEDSLEIKQKNTTIKIATTQNKETEEVENTVMERERETGIYDLQKEIIHNNIVRNVKRIQNMSNTNISEAISLLQQINESDVEMADKTLQKVESLTRSAE